MLFSVMILHMGIPAGRAGNMGRYSNCLLYTSDAADDIALV